MEIKHKRGNTFILQIELSGPDGLPLDLTDVDVKSQVKNSTGSLTQEFVVTKIDTSSVELKMIDTSLWPVGKLQFDIQYKQNDGSIFSTDIIDIIVKPTITEGI